MNYVNGRHEGEDGLPSPLLEIWASESDSGRWYWRGACFGFAASAGSAFFGTIAWIAGFSGLAGASSHTVANVGAALLIAFVPLLFFAAFCLDRIEASMHAVRDERPARDVPSGLRDLRALRG